MLSFNESPEEETSLWDNPINDTSGVLSINGQDNLVLYGKKKPNSSVLSGSQMFRSHQPATLWLNF
jgi:hypothetical protein